MIALNSDALVFTTARGELIPCSAESVVIELIGSAASRLDPELLREASSAVLHHFKVELGQPCVTVGEFAQALAKVLRGFGLQVEESAADPNPVPGPGLDLRTLATGPAGSAELFFFARLRSAVRDQLAAPSSITPRAVRFSGLRSCVKRLAGARRWSRRCEQLQDQIVDYLRHCFDDEAGTGETVLVVR
jgi:hypothetical protein